MGKTRFTLMITLILLAAGSGSVGAQTICGLNYQICMEACMSYGPPSPQCRRDCDVAYFSCSFGGECTPFCPI